MEWYLPSIAGLVAGALGRLMLPGMHPAGFVVTISLGVAGAYFGAVVGLWLGWYRGVGNAEALVASFLGAALFLGIYLSIVRSAGPQ